MLLVALPHKVKEGKVTHSFFSVQAIALGKLKVKPDQHKCGRL